MEGVYLGKVWLEMKIDILLVGLIIWAIVMIGLLASMVYFAIHQHHSLNEFCKENGDTYSGENNLPYCLDLENDIVIGKYRIYYSDGMVYREALK